MWLILFVFEFYEGSVMVSVSLLGKSSETYLIQYYDPKFIQMCCDTGLLSAVWVWMLVKTQFGDVSSAVSLFF